jgi:hypothetical protein
LFARSDAVPRILPGFAAIAAFAFPSRAQQTNSAFDTLIPLSDITVPLPDDPIGKPFRYEVDGTTAHLRGSPPRGEEKNADFNVHYEVILRK